VQVSMIIIFVCSIDMGIGDTFLLILLAIFDTRGQPNFGLGLGFGFGAEISIKFSFGLVSFSVGCTVESFGFGRNC